MKEEKKSEKKNEKEKNEVYSRIDFCNFSLLSAHLNINTIFTNAIILGPLPRPSSDYSLVYVFIRRVLLALSCTYSLAVHSLTRCKFFRAFTYPCVYSLTRVALSLSSGSQP